MPEHYPKLQMNLLPVPDGLRKLIPRHVEIEYQLRFLEINGRAHALAELVELLKKDPQDVAKLMRNLHLQLKSKELLRNPKKVQRGKKPEQQQIFEVKATCGHSRLFAFFSPDGMLVICTNTYWKTSTDPKQQNKEFDKAAKLRQLFISNSAQREGKK